MNKNQRNRNRRTAAWLKVQTYTCPNCNAKGYHWFPTSHCTLEDLVSDREPQGFWVCPSLYNEQGERIDGGEGWAVRVARELDEAAEILAENFTKYMVSTEE